jgi:hypothetical protein
VLVAVLERKGILTQQEVLEEIKQFRAKAVKAARDTTSAERSRRS